VVILHKLPVADQDLSHIENPINVRGKGTGCLCIVDTEHITIFQPDHRTVYGVDWYNPCGLSRPFYLHLGADSKEITKDMHCCRIDSCCGKPGIPRSPVTEAEPAFPHRVRENRAPSNKITEILVLWLDRIGIGIRALRSTRCQLIEPFPPVHLHCADILLDFRSFERKTLGQHKCHPPPDRVRLDPFQIAVPSNLFLLGSFPINAYRAITNDEADLPLSREVLEVHYRVILPDLLDIPFDLFRTGNIPADAECPPDIISNKNRECLGCAPCTPYRTSIINSEVFRPVIILSNSNLCNPLCRGCHHPLGEHSHGRPDGMVKDLFAGLFTKPALNKIVTDPECSLLPAHSGFQLPDAGCNPADSKECLHPVCKVTGDRNLNSRPGIDPHCPGSGGYLQGCSQSVLKALFIRFHHPGSLHRHFKLLRFCFVSGTQKVDRSGSRSLVLSFNRLHHPDYPGFAHPPERKRSAFSEIRIVAGICFLQPFNGSGAYSAEGCRKKTPH